ncbi:MAG: hypothetical protein LHV69_05345 [Elusimicrobia bacterium]|nr:hypothetical protein [Candidatus Obscuribacterium magneticum]
MITNVIRRAGTLLNKYYLAFMIVVSPFVLVLNWRAKVMRGILPNYLQFKSVFSSWFQPTGSAPDPLTFPMWGYGWLLFFTENKLILLLFQLALGLFSTWFLIRDLEKCKLGSPGMILSIKFLMVIAFPWYALHSLQWPHSPTVSLMVLSFVLFLRFSEASSKSIFLPIISGALFGISLNFRSDFIFIPLLFLILSLLLRGSGPSLVRAVMWVLSVYIMLLPWAFYTHKVTGHYLMTSTNGGAVLYCGLGQLPGNKWGITVSDEDPSMVRLLRERFGDNINYVSYEASQLLKKEFFRLVREDPKEFLRKAAYAAFRVWHNGAYRGEFFERPSCEPNCETEFLRIRRHFMRHPLTLLPLPMNIRIRFLAEFYSDCFGRIIVLLSFLMVPATLLYSLKSKNLLILSSILFILYNAAINIIAVNVVSSTLTFVFHINNFSYGLDLIVQRFRKS